MMISNDKMKELSLGGQLSAFMLAIALENHVITAGNSLVYFTAEDLCTESNSYNVQMSRGQFSASLPKVKEDLLSRSPTES